MVKLTRKLHDVHCEGNTNDDPSCDQVCLVWQGKDDKFGVSRIAV
jgi:hypothetical protein